MKKRIAFTLIAACFTTQLVAADTVTQTYNGLTHNANYQHAEERADNAATVLITHGTLAHNGMDIIATLQSLLADSGYDSLAINLSLGVNDREGMYDCSTPHTHKHMDAVAEIGLWVDWLKQQGDNRIVLMGHSRGGNQTALYAAGQSDPRVVAQILIAPQTWSEADATAEYEARFKQPLHPLIAAASERDPGQPLENIGFIYCDNATVSPASFLGYYQPNPNLDTPSLLKTASMPTLVFAGSEDTTVKNLEPAMQQVSNTAVRTVLIEGADHFFRDLYADELVENAVEFIEGL